MPAAVEKLLLASQTSMLTTGLNSLANNGLALSAEFDNTIGAAGDGYIFADVELYVTYGSAPTANTAPALWILQTPDGTNYEQGGDGSTTPARMPDTVFPVLASTSAQRLVRRVLLPWGKLKFLIKNDGTGQAMAASGNTLKVRPVTRETV